RLADVRVVIVVGRVERGVEAARLGGRRRELRLALAPALQRSPQRRLLPAPQFGRQVPAAVRMAVVAHARMVPRTAPARIARRRQAPPAVPGAAATKCALLDRDDPVAEEERLEEGQPVALDRLLPLRT